MKRTCLIIAGFIFVLELVALSKGIDGVALSLAIGSLAGIFGSLTGFVGKRYLTPPPD